MEPFSKITSNVVYFPESDIDTDVIFPSRFLLITEKIGLGRYAFYEKRYVDGVERVGFPLNLASAKNARILIAGNNFGCGSSREHAVWALHDLGLRCVIAPSFGEIFHANCFKSGVLPIVLAPEVLAPLRDFAVQGADLTVDLARNVISSPDGKETRFEVEEWRREALLNGWDEVLTLLNSRSDAITAFERSRREVAPWLFAAD